MPKGAEVAQSIKYAYTHVDKEKWTRLTNRAIEDPSPEYASPLMLLLTLDKTE